VDESEKKRAKLIAGLKGAKATIEKERE